MWDHRLKLWNTMATRERMRSTWRRSAGSGLPRRPRLRRIASPPIVTSPPSGTSSMLMQRSMVDLPEPEAPRIARTSPSWAWRETPFSTSSGPKLLRRSLMATAGGADGARTGTAVAGAAAPASDMGRLQLGLPDVGRPPQVRREPVFQGHDGPRHEEVQDEVDRPGADEDLDGPEGLADQLLGDPRHLHHGDHGGERGRLDHQDDLIAVAGQRLARGDREDDAAEQGPAA